MMKMYEYTNKVIESLRKRYIRLFSRFKALNSYDELNVITNAKDLYSQLDELTQQYLLMIAQKVHKQYKGRSDIDLMWLHDYLLEYNPVSKYVYAHEVDRKRARFEESLIASENKVQEIETALRYYSNMATWYAIDITDRAIKQAYIDNGVTKVQWITTDDEKTCLKCWKRNHNIYNINDVPPKPHLNCRCYIIPYKE